jgi:hypothetical protein
LTWMIKIKYGQCEVQKSFIIIRKRAVKKVRSLTINNSKLKIMITFKRSKIKEGTRSRVPTQMTKT